MGIAIRQATTPDVEIVSSILREAAQWLNDTGKPMWRDDELEPGRITNDVTAGLFFLAESDGETAGTVRFQLEDPIVWPDLYRHNATYIHRLAVRRKFAGGVVSSAVFHWAIERARTLGRRYVRLDCEASRPRLRAIYEDFGFIHHSDRKVGPYLVSRYEYDVSENDGRS
jgi:GNAT superfamily N-acetyltransferase